MKKLKLNHIYQGDCLKVLKDFPDNYVDSIVTDPPYGLEFMGKEWDKFGISEARAKRLTTNYPSDLSRGSKGLPEKGRYSEMTIKEKSAFQEFIYQWATEALRVLKPGGYLLSFGGTRTYHRMACAIEDAGFEIRDMLCWAYGQGFPKSLNVWKQLKKECICGNMEAYEKRIQSQRTLGKKETEYYLRFLQEANLSQTLGSRKEQGEILQSQLRGTKLSGTLQDNQQGEKSEKRIENGKEPSLERRSDLQKTKGQLQGSEICQMPEKVSKNGEERRLHNATQVSDGSTPKQTTSEDGSGASHRPQSEQQQYREPCAFCKQWGTQATRTYGIGTALKPSIEPICMARKPLSEKSVASNVLKWKTGGINIDESRVDYTSEKDKKEGQSARKSNAKTCFDNFTGKKPNYFDRSERSELQGRFPANLIHDGSDEVVRGCFPGNASRFFYCAKASKAERNMGCEGLEKKQMGRNQSSLDGGKMLTGSGNERSNTKKNNHPTVKPLSLMCYLVKLVTPPKGICLDPFIGSGTTGIACFKEEFNYIGIEMEEDYVRIARARIKAATKQGVLF